MSTPHPVEYTVTAQRNNLVVVVHRTDSHDEAIRLKDQFERVDGTTAVITEIHDRAETDLTTHTRELVEDLAARGHASR